MWQPVRVQAVAPGLLGRSGVPLELVVARRRQPVEATRGSCSVGGGPADTYPVPGLRPGALRLHIESARVLVVARGPAWVRGIRLRPGAPLLLSPGEELRLTRRGGVRLLHRPEAAPLPLGTRSLLRRLLAGQEPGSGIGVPRLVCVSGPDLGRSLLLPHGTFELGRASECVLRLLDPAVARWQARLHVEGEGVWLEDLGSYGGTRVNGRRIHRRRPLAPGDLIGAGRTLLRFLGAVRPLGLPPVPTAATAHRWRLAVLLGAALALAGVAGLAAMHLVRAG